MKKSIIAIFLVVGALLLCLIVWAFVFGNGVETIWNAVIAPINAAWEAITGDDTLIPQWNDDNGRNIENKTGEVGNL